MLSENNLKLAYTQVKRNKGASGVDGMEESQLRYYLDEHLGKIKDMIRNKIYKPNLLEE